MTETTTEQKPEAAAEKPAAPALKAILARKIGMTQVYDAKGEFIPVTVLEAGPCPVIQVKTQASHGYSSVQLGFGARKAKNFSKPEAGHFAKVGIAPLQWIREFRLPQTDGFATGQEIRVEQFAAGDSVDVSGVIKGKGFAGAVKRHRFKGGPQTHGQSDRWRAPGSSGRERVWPGKRGPGHMGAEWNTVQRLEVVSVDAEKNLMLVRGGVPGPDGGCVSVYATTRPRRKRKIAPISKKSVKSQTKAAAKPAEKK